MDQMNVTLGNIFTQTTLATALSDGMDGLAMEFIMYLIIHANVLVLDANARVKVTHLIWDNAKAATFQMMHSAMWILQTVVLATQAVSALAVDVMKKHMNAAKGIARDVETASILWGAWQNASNAQTALRQASI